MCMINQSRRNRSFVLSPLSPLSEASQLRKSRGDPEHDFMTSGDPSLSQIDWLNTDAENDGLVKAWPVK